MFDAVSDDDDDTPPEPKRQRTINFSEAVVDNKLPATAKLLRTTALQPPITIDDENKVNMEGPNPTKCKIAFSNQRRPCYRPAVGFE
uniref:Uncharacterized protein n=1 Tax=Panagrolaimus davidi TaxID=227884 RepID=A0A914QKH7_9BILA